MRRVVEHTEWRRGWQGENPPAAAGRNAAPESGSQLGADFIRTSHNFLALALPILREIPSLAGAPERSKQAPAQFYLTTQIIIFDIPK
jgi:hypothetical protein